MRALRLFACALTLLACQKSAGRSSPPLQAAPRSPPQQKNVEPLPVCKPRGLPSLEAARKLYDAGHYEDALACAADAAAESPDDPDAQSEKGAALSALGKLDEAQLAYAHALALDPDHLDALLGAAHLFGAALPSSRERDELAEVYAERGLKLARKAKDQGLTAEFALLSAMAYNDLGQSKDALERADDALRYDTKDYDAQYERALALFELCRFKDAKTAFTQLLADKDHRAHASYHLGLLLEREGKWKQASARVALAHTLDPADFPEPVAMSREEFHAAVAAAVKALPIDMQRDLAQVPVTAEDIPSDDDLMGGDPPLSPTILGIFRGPPLGQVCLPEDGTPCRSVSLFRLNLARATSSKAELLEQIRITLLHEVGHLRGEDDQQLAARGLE